MPRHIVCLTFDHDHLSGFIARGLTTPTVISRGEYDVVVIPRLVSLLDRYGIKATFFTPGHTIDSTPHAVMPYVEDGHELAHHGWTHRLPVALRNATANAHLQLRPLLLDQGDAPQQREHLLIGLLAHAARVQQHDVRLVLVHRGTVPERLQRARQLLAVVHVHLAAECVDVIATPLHAVETNPRCALVLSRKFCRMKRKKASPGLYLAKSAAFLIISLA